ncbi:Tim44 domain-containing protein [Alphaproteobacteria bacterium KMM 3653]|uniref:Tim44 domain-containing protein n=1 Tax=Harenicola maris TaxID=2841044 RepID=A0AAP2G4B0_9RHOB|nr:Tim44 domain-containing protein [Harenicola maris]
MGSAVIQLLVLAGVAIFLILRLRSVLGTREGFEKPRVPAPGPSTNTRRGFDVIEGGPDRDIIDHADEGSDAALALAAMKAREPSFGVSDFLSGAKGAYEMILMAFENGDLSDVQPFLDEEVYETLQSVIDARAEQGVIVEASFVGVRDTTLVGAEFDESTGMAEITVRFVCELTSVVRATDGTIIEGSPTEIKRQKDVWTFARPMGSGDPNWNLVATGE